MEAAWIESTHVVVPASSRRLDNATALPLANILVATFDDNLKKVLVNGYNLDDSVNAGLNAPLTAAAQLTSGGGNMVLCG